MYHTGRGTAATQKLIPSLFHILLYLAELPQNISDTCVQDSHHIYITADVFLNAHQYLTNKTNDRMTILFRHQHKGLPFQKANEAQAMLACLRDRRRQLSRKRESRT